MKNVLITGGTGGIGRALGAAFAAKGNTVAITYNKSSEKAKMLESEYGVIAIKADFSKKEGAEKVFNAFPEVDILVNNAGISISEPFDSVRTASELYDINLLSAVELTRLVLPGMIRRGDGCIINISSIWGKHGASCEVDYSTSKAGLIGFSKALAKEVGPAGIRVNCICPGVIDTDMLNDYNQEEINALIDRTPLDRLGTPEDISNTALFLASEEAAFITGAVIDVDGGFC